MGELTWIGDDGLRFSCTQCGRCCTGNAQGFVFVSPRECTLIAKRLNLSVAEFLHKYTHPDHGRISLNMVRGTSTEAQCMFLRNRKCLIHDIRPRQCRAWPFWPRNVESRFAWEKTKAECPGIGRGERFSKAAVEVISCTAFAV